MPRIDVDGHGAIDAGSDSGDDRGDGEWMGVDREHEPVLEPV